MDLTLTVRIGDLADGTDPDLIRADIENLIRRSLDEDPADTTTLTVDTDPEKTGLTAARRLSNWKIGDPTWADDLIEAYLDPAKAQARVDADMARYDA